MTKIGGYFLDKSVALIRAEYLWPIYLLEISASCAFTRAPVDLLLAEQTTQ